MGYKRVASGRLAGREESDRENRGLVVEDTTIGKREYTPGILEMTAIYQLYTRKIADNLLGIQKVWYMSGIH